MQSLTDSSALTIEPLLSLLLFQCLKAPNLSSLHAIATILSIWTLVCSSSQESMAIYRWLYNIFLVLSLGLIDTSSAELLISAPERVPLGASQIVDHAFGSFSFAVHVFADYAGAWLFPRHI